MQVPVYACPVLATPPRAFVHDVSPGLASLARRFVNFVFVRLRMPGAGNTGACLRPRCVPGLGTPAAMRRQHHLLPGAPLLRHHCAHANSAPPCARGSMATSSTSATLTRHRPWHSSHGYLDHGSTTHALGYLDKRHKGLPPCLSNLVGCHSSHDSAMHQPLRLWGGGLSVGLLSDSSPVSPSASLPL